MTRHRQPSLIPLLLAAGLVAGCAGSSDRYPSLAVRDAERVSGQFTPVAPTEPPVAPVATPQDITAILATASASDARFHAAETGARQLIQNARGTGADSNARARALVALADLTSLRGQTAIALASLDTLYAQAATGFAPLDQIRAAQEEVARLVDAQDRALDSLTAELS